MQLGAFSISLSVKDLKASQNFYEKIGFQVFAGNSEHNYLIMKNKDAVIGLFQGMFEKNILTFNPGWDQNCNTLPEFSDIREIYKSIKNEGIQCAQESMEGDSGPGSFVMVDPDGNQILIDQHI